MDRLGPPGGRVEKPARLDAVAQLRDAGERLKHLLARYDRLVTRLADGRLPVPDLMGRIEWLNLQLAGAAEQLQELIVLDCERPREVPFRRAPAGPRAAPRRFVMQRTVEGRI